MKIGVRKPNLSKSLKARTTSNLKRKVKKAIIPIYGQKGTGIIKDPKRAIYNKVYNQTTVDALGSIKKGRSQKQNQAINTPVDKKIHPASSWYFPVGLLALCTLLYFITKIILSKQKKISKKPLTKFRNMKNKLRNREVMNNVS